MRAAICWALLAAFMAGALWQHSRSRDANALIRAGFTILDPEGFPVERFE